MKEYFDDYYPIFEALGMPRLTEDMLFNPIYPDHYLWNCKASRKRIRRRK